MKRLLAYLALLSLGLSACAKGTGHTELIVDGKYKPFNVPRKTMEKLMKLIETEDIDYIYAVFSQRIRENKDDLYEKIQEFIHFCKKNITSWDFSSASENTQRTQGVTVSKRVSLYKFCTNSGTYRCDISDVINITSQNDVIGFSGILIFPEELSKEYASLQPSGISIVYRVGDEPEGISTELSALETLLRLTEEGDVNAIYDGFSLTTREKAEMVQEKLPELMDFLREKVVSWEPYTWTQNLETIDGAEITTRETFFYLHTDSELYRCDIREVLENSKQEKDTGISSISIFPAQYPGERPPREDKTYIEHCTWGQKNAGISIVY